MTEIYLISPPQIEPDGFLTQLEIALATNKIVYFQLRLKNVDKDFISEIAAQCLPLCHKHNVPLIINDHPDIATKIGADGVHIGNEDSSYNAARKIVGQNKIVGVSCYDNFERAAKMAKEGADYVAFGAFYPTATKQAKTRADISLLEKWCDLELPDKPPAVAIGGINSGNAASLSAADYIAVISAVWGGNAGVVSAIEELATSCKL